MAFRYSLRQKRLAKQNDSSVLHKAYEISERKLDYYARKGSKKDLDKAMQKHQDIEYALLYQQSPEFRASKKIVYTGKGRTIKQNNKGRKRISGKF
ncbi:MAG: hypothetical protein ACI4L1_00635 [Christensenellales bacterium]